MNTRALVALTTSALLALTACSSNDSADNPTSTSSASAASKPATASTAFTHISGTVTTAKFSGTVTADNDPNHLLGRPHQYTSKVTFTDSRIKAADVEGLKEGDVERGGAIEVFADPTDAEARAKYIQTVTQSLPALAEYDYVHGTVLVRVSHYLTPKQAGEYEAALKQLS